MPWVEVTSGTPELTFTDDGVLKWNTALQLLMGDPKWVDIMRYLTGTKSQIGIRAVNSPTGLPVIAEPEGSEYKLDSPAILAAAGISVAVTVTGEPDSWQQTTAPGTGSSQWFGYQPIYYLTLPT